MAHRRRHTWLLLLACAANAAPLWLARVFGTDLPIHLPSLHCFTQQFWEGDLLPSWCFDADTGLGSPRPLYYFPLAYYAAAALYPPVARDWFDLLALYSLAVTLATVCTAFAARLWLRDFAGERAATIGAIAFLFLPYRSELMFFRSGYAELWAFALFPLLAREARRLARHQPHATPRLAALVALALLANVPATVGVLAGVGLMTCVLSGNDPRPTARFALAVTLALAATAFYSLPAMNYEPFIQLYRMTRDDPAWPNRFLTRADFAEHGRLLAGSGLSLAAMLLLGATNLCRRGRIRDGTDRRDTIAWAVAGLGAVPMVFPISKPVWDALNHIAHVGFPWRMQGFVCLALTTSGVLYARLLAGPGQRARWPGDVGAVMGLMLFIAAIDMRVVGREDKWQVFRNALPLRALYTAEYLPVWADPDDNGPDHLAARHAQRGSRVRARAVQGDADVGVLEWTWHAIRLQTDTRGPATVRLDHRYFPTWQAADQDERPVALRPERRSGLMLVDVGPETRLVTIRPRSRWDLMVRPPDAPPVPTGGGTDVRVRQDSARPNDQGVGGLGAFTSR